MVEVYPQWGYTSSIQFGDTINLVPEKRRREFDTHVRLDPDIAAGLKEAVEQERLPQTWIINRALREWLERRGWRPATSDA
jgi:hypothetical protein